MDCICPVKPPTALLPTPVSPSTSACLSIYRCLCLCECQREVATLYVCMHLIQRYTRPINIHGPHTHAHTQTQTGWPRRKLATVGRSRSSASVDPGRERDAAREFYKNAVCANICDMLLINIYIYMETMCIILVIRKVVVKDRTSYTHSHTSNTHTESHAGRFPQSHFPHV